MKVVLDTNILVSGLITPGGPCGRILRLLVEDLLLLCLDARILWEYEIVLPRPELEIDPDDVEEALELVREIGEVVAARPLPSVLPHEDDRAFLEVAATAGAVLVTGNKRHYPKRARGQVAVVNCTEFLDLLQHASEGQ